MKYVVLGSGLSGYSAVLGLCQIGIKPIVIDIGLTSNSNTLGFEDTSRTILAKKKLFNSDHMYKYPLDKLDIDVEFNSNAYVNYHLSSALGGMSTVWGAGLQPVKISDELHPPNTLVNELEKAQIEILKKISHNYVPDELDEKYAWPIESKNSESIYISNYFSKVKKAYQRKRHSMQDILVGFPKLAVKKSGEEFGCILCGKCLEGCPSGSILNSGTELTKLIYANKITYIKGIVSEIKILEDKKTEIIYTDEYNNDLSLQTDYVFIGLGPIATPILLLKSNLINRPITVKDSQVFYLVFLRGLISAFKQKFSLAQLVVTNKDKIKVDRNHYLSEFNLSLFEYSKDWDDRLGEVLKKIRFNNKVSRFMARIFLKYVISGIGFIATSESGYFIISKDQGKINVRGQLNSETSNNLKIYTKYINNKMRKIGLIPIPFNLNKDPILGGGWHMGSGLPMGGCKEIDWNSKLDANANIYIIDATSLPEIKPGSHTFSAMVNAYRTARFIKEREDNNCF